MSFRLWTDRPVPNLHAVRSMDRRRPIATQDRRQWLAESSLGFGSIALAHLLSGDGLAATASAARQSAGPVPHKPGGAQSVIFLFMQGGPSHLETFDPKPVLRRMDGQSLPESFKGIDLAQTNTSDGRLMGPAFPFYKSRTCWGSPVMSISSGAAVCMRNAVSKSAIRASNRLSPPRASACCRFQRFS